MAKTFEQNKFDKIIILNKQYDQLETDKTDCLRKMDISQYYGSNTIHFIVDLFEYVSVINDCSKIHNIIKIGLCDFIYCYISYAGKYGHKHMNSNTTKIVIRYYSDNIKDKTEYIEKNINKCVYELYSYADNFQFDNIDELIELTDIFINIGIDINSQFTITDYNGSIIEIKNSQNIDLILYNILTFIIEKNIFFGENNYDSLIIYVDYLISKGLTNENLILFIEFLYTELFCNISINYYKVKVYLENKYNVIFDNKKIIDKMLDNKDIIIIHTYSGNIDNDSFNEIINSLSENVDTIN